MCARIHTIEHDFYLFIFSPHMMMLFWKLTVQTQTNTHLYVLAEYLLVKCLVCFSDQYLNDKYREWKGFFLLSFLGNDLDMSSGFFFFFKFTYWSAAAFSFFGTISALISSLLFSEPSSLSYTSAANINYFLILLFASMDGVPFLMRDFTLRRTTDVEKVFPDRQMDEASLFNWTDLQQLNAGRWFLKVVLGF